MTGSRTRPQEFRCTLDSPDAEAQFRAFTRAICGEDGHARHAVLVQTTWGARCLLENSGRCIGTDTPWSMAQQVLAPVFTFDPGVEWVALFAMDDWQMRLDAALAASLADGGSWAARLAEEMLTELPCTTRLIVSRQ